MVAAAVVPILPITKADLAEAAVAQRMAAANMETVSKVVVTAAIAVAPIRNALAHFAAQVPASSAHSLA